MEDLLGGKRLGGEGSFKADKLVFNLKRALGNIKRCAELCAQASHAPPAEPARPGPHLPRRVAGAPEQPRTAVDLQENREGAEATVQRQPEYIGHAPA